MARARTNKEGDFVWVVWDDITDIIGWSKKGQKHTCQRFESSGWIVNLPQTAKGNLVIKGDREWVHNDRIDDEDEGRIQVIPYGGILSIKNRPHTEAEIWELDKLKE